MELWLFTGVVWQLHGSCPRSDPVYPVPVNVAYPKWKLVWFSLCVCVRVCMWKSAIAVWYIHWLLLIKNVKSLVFCLCWRNPEYWSRFFWGRHFYLFPIVLVWVLLLDLEVETQKENVHVLVKMFGLSQLFMQSKSVTPICNAELPKS